MYILCCTHRKNIVLCVGYVCPRKCLVPLSKSKECLTSLDPAEILYKYCGKVGETHLKKKSRGYPRSDV